MREREIERLGGGRVRETKKEIRSKTRERKSVKMRDRGRDGE